MRKLSVPKVLSLLTFSLLAIALASCESKSHKNLLKEDGHYWQRTGTSSAIYLRGPKAQQRLNKNISQCVVEIKELIRLGSIAEAIPGKEKETEAESELSEFETPERDGFNRREYLEYQDFESCMHAKGWERVKYVPYDVANKALSTYEMTHVKFRESEEKKKSRAKDDFKNLND